MIKGRDLGICLAVFFLIVLVASILQRHTTTTNGSTERPQILESTAEVVTLDEREISYHPDLHIRGEWQRKQIKNFCTRNGFGKLKYSLNITQPLKREFYRHIILDNKSKNLFCFLPKIGCRTTRTILLVSTGNIPQDTIRVKQGKAPTEEDLQKGLMKSSFLSESLTDEMRINKLKSYGKYTVLRHPLQRILSAYNDKIGTPLTTKPFLPFSDMKRRMLEKYQPNEYSLWIRNNSISINVKFQEYIMWLLEQDFDTLNEHFSPQYHNSQPCRVRYDYYGNFDSFENDFFVILNMFNIDGSAVLNQLPKGNVTATLLKIDSSWSPLPLLLKHKLYEKCKIDFEFYHSLYPAERSITNKYLEL